MRSLIVALALFIALPAAAQDKLRIVASFSILGDLVAQVAGDAATVQTLVGADQDAHVFEPSPADARTVAQAQVVVINGLGFEGWQARLVKASGYKGPVITAAQGIPTRTMKGGHDHGHGHSHGGGSDPHIWQDPQRAARMVTNIAEGLAKADPGRAATYRANAEAYRAKLTELDAWVATEIASVPADRRKVVTSHDAFSYFGDRYKVRFLSPQGISTDSEPSAKAMAGLIRTLRAEGVKTIFVENISNPRLLEQLAREAGAKVGPRLYSDALSKSDGPTPSYIAMIRYNTGLLRAAMQGE